MQKTDAKVPKINIIVLTYNRAHLVERSVDSILRQTYRDFEIILVNNGSTDNTREVLKKYENNEQVRLFELKENRGFAGGMNFGLDQVRSEWFTNLGDDDEMVEDGFETFLRIPEEIDPEINAVTCNCFDTRTQSMTGTGFDRDQYLSIDQIINKAKGDFWGLTKTELLGDKRLNEKIRGYENTFWYKIDAIANRYYIHKPIKISHTGHVRETSAQSVAEIGSRADLYRHLLEEPFYWEVLQKYNPHEYVARCLRGILFSRLAGDKQTERAYRQMLMAAHLNAKERLLSSLISNIDARVLNLLYRTYGKLSAPDI